MLDKDSLAIFLIGVVIFTIGLNPEFIGYDCRFAVFAQEMLRNGPTFFPTTYGQPYPDYPGTSTFLIYLVSLPFGKVTLFTAILPTAIISAFILVLIYRSNALKAMGYIRGFLCVIYNRFFQLFAQYLDRSIYYPNNNSVFLPCLFGRHLQEAQMSLVYAYAVHGRFFFSRSDRSNYSCRRDMCLLSI